MTDAELRFTRFFITSDASRPASLPDWQLALIVGDRPNHLSHELNTALSLMRVPRLRPGTLFDAARALVGARVSRPPWERDPTSRKRICTNVQRCCVLELWCPAAV